MHFLKVKCNQQKPSSRIQQNHLIVPDKPFSVTRHRNLSRKPSLQRRVPSQGRHRKAVSATPSAQSRKRNAVTPKPSMNVSNQYFDIFAKINYS